MTMVHIHLSHQHSEMYKHHRRARPPSAPKRGVRPGCLLASSFLPFDVSLFFPIQPPPPSLYTPERKQENTYFEGGAGGRRDFETRGSCSVCSEDAHPPRRRRMQIGQRLPRPPPSLPPPPSNRPCGFVNNATGERTTRGCRVIKKQRRGAFKRGAFSPVDS